MSRPRLVPATPAPVRVGIGQLRVAEPPERLAIFGIGSCVAVFLHDREARRGGLAHPLLPAEPSDSLPPEVRAKYAPAAVQLLAEEMRQHRRSRPSLVAKVIGGASMFSPDGASPGNSIGRRNVEAILASLDRLSIPVLARETGGTIGRSLVADPATGVVEVWSLGVDHRTL